MFNLAEPNLFKRWNVVGMMSTTTTTEGDADVHFSPSILRSIKEKVVTTDLINQLDIADGLKELLVSKAFTLKSLLLTSASDLAKILGTDEYVSKIVRDAIKRSIGTRSIDCVIDSSFLYPLLLV